MGSSFDWASVPVTGFKGRGTTGFPCSCEECGMGGMTATISTCLERMVGGADANLGRLTWPDADVGLEVCPDTDLAANCGLDSLGVGVGGGCFATNGCANAPPMFSSADRLGPGVMPSLTSISWTALRR